MIGSNHRALFEEEKIIVAIKDCHLNRPQFSIQKGITKRIYDSIFSTRIFPPSTAKISNLYKFGEFYIAITSKIYSKKNYAQRWIDNLAFIQLYHSVDSMKKEFTKNTEELHLQISLSNIFQISQP